LPISITSDAEGSVPCVRNLHDTMLVMPTLQATTIEWITPTAAQMWDVDSCDGNGEPRLMATGSYHTAGIWSADTCGARVLTSSKDGSVTSAMLTQTGIHAVRVFDEHHAGIVKCVRGRDAHVFADCGADGLVCVLDDRVAGSGVVRHLKRHQ